MKKWNEVFLTCAILVGSLIFAVNGIVLPRTVEASDFETSTEVFDEYNVPQEEKSDPFAIRLTPHTKEEIREFVKNHPAQVDEDVKTLEEPSFKKKFNKAGVLSKETLQSALNITNHIRFIAGLSGMVSLDEKYVKFTQAASYINVLNDDLSHYPKKPKGVPNSLYKDAYEGASCSNIAFGHNSINTSIVFGYMYDGDSSNIDRLGHRRCILNPNMGATGFGYAGNYSALYVFDSSNVNASENGVMWPAQAMPTDYFDSDFPWSISFDEPVPESGVSVLLERLSDGKKWSFSNEKSNGYFNISNIGYGQSSCIIFMPDKIEEYTDGDEFQVTINGLGKTLSYKVAFFDLIPVTEISALSEKIRMDLDSGTYVEFNVEPKDATNPSIRLISDKKDIFAIKGTYLYPKRYGKSKITGKSLSGGLEDVTYVEVVPSTIWDVYIGKPYGNSLRLSYNKVYKVTGYEIQYALDKKFTKEKKKVTTKNTGITLKNLKKKTNYYIRVRGFAKTKEGMVYGDFSDVKKVRNN